MDKQELAQQILNKYKLGNFVPPEKQPVNLQERFAEIDNIASGQSTTTKPRQSFIEKVAGVTGGKILAQGLSQAIANKEISKGIEETQNQQIEIQGKLLNQIKENKAIGKDTSRLENALKLITEDATQTGEGAEKLLNQNDLTAKQVVGDTLQLGTTVLGAGQLPGVAKKALAEAGVIAGAKQGAIQGAKTGAIYGASSGASKALKEDKSIADVAKSTAGGALAGGTTGGILGGVIGGVSGGIKVAKIAKQEKVIDYIKPDASQISGKQYESLLKQGRITPKTATKRAEYVLSDIERETAQKYSNLIKKDPVKTTTNMMDEISRQDADVGQYLRSNNGIFNKGELKNYLKNSIKDISDIAVDDKTLTKNKTKFVENFVKSLDKNDLENLWQTRKNFDREIEKAFGSSTLSNKLKVELRNAVQDFISDRTDNVTYKAAMKEMSGLFKLRDLALTKATKERAKSALGLWIKNNPVAAKVIGAVGGGLALKETLID